ncbi:AP-4 complex subunit sigma [Nymphaea thermarum]|nr:AP-4 complex subunit sigma [Nymphaea thermarum]
MGIQFVLLVNKQGQTRLAQYYEYLTLEERRALEGEIVRKCLTRTDQQARTCSLTLSLGIGFSSGTLLLLQSRKLFCSFVEHRNYKIVYKRYASLFFMVGVDNDENELAILEFIHLLVETMDQHFGNVCELDIMFHLEKAHFMLEEMVMNGCVVETSKSNILAPIQLMDKAS